MSCFVALYLYFLLITTLSMFQQAKCLPPCQHAYNLINTTQSTAEADGYDISFAGIQS